MLTLTFFGPLGEYATQARATGFRLCADATLRGHDNSVTATRVDGSWRVARRAFQQFECAGPVMVIVRRTASGRRTSMGPYASVRAGAALIWADGELLSLRVPGWATGCEAVHEVSLVDATPEGAS